MKLSFKKIEWKAGRQLLSLGTSAGTDWKIILTSTLILSVLVIVLSIYMFIKIDKREVFVVEKPEDLGDKNLNLNVLRETVSYYQNKALEFERIKKEEI